MGLHDFFYKKHAYKKHEAENWPKNKKHLRNMARLKFQKHKKWKKHGILVRTNFKTIQTIQTTTQIYIHIHTCVSIFGLPSPPAA